MKIKNFIIGGCLFSASFFVACQQPTETESQASSPVPAEQEPVKKELDVNEPSELALLMRDMYDRNRELKTQIKDGEIPESFPEDWLNIHTATSNETLNETFEALAEQYLNNMEAITKAETKEEGIKAYNNMISTCASCHTIYCQGPLAKIKKLKIKDFQAES